MTKIVSLHSDGFYRKKGQLLFEEGMDWVNQRNYVQAKLCFESACQFDSNNLEYKFYAGITNYILDDLSVAEMYLEQAIKAEPFNVEYHYSYGLVLYRLNKEDQSLAMFQTILKHEPEHIDTKVYLAKILYEKEQYQEAIVLLNQVVLKEPTRYEAFCELGCSYLALYNLRKAEDMLIKTIHLNKRYVIAYYYLSKVYLKQGKHDSSIKVLLKLKEECPEEKELVDKNISVIETLKSI